MPISADFAKLIDKLKPCGADVSACIINLGTGEHLEYNANKFIYPASTYKIFIAAEVLRQVEIGKIKPTDIITIKSPNDIDAEARFYPTDVFPVLKAGDKVKVETLLTLMLERSDNTASNTLIDLVSRESISKNILKANNWGGSDVTRKFLNRVHEEKSYRYAEVTVTCGRHLAEFMEKVYNDELISPYVSKCMKKYMSDGSKKDLLSDKLIHRRKENWLGGVVYEKGGWVQASSRRSLYLLKHRYQSQAAVVKTPTGYYAIGILSKYKTVFPWKYFKFSKITDYLSES